jgi:hypothetical protein
MTRWLAVLVAVSLLACGNDSSGPGEGVEGQWSGTVTPGVTLTLTLTERDGEVSGAGTLTAASDAVALDTEGTYSEPSLSLTLTSEGFQDMNLTATVGDQVLTSVAS